MLERYVYKGNQKLRCGYTTGSCAAAAAKAGAVMLFAEKTLEWISILTPKGIPLNLEVKEITRGDDFVTCGIQKDSGDDADVTNGILVFATVSKTDKDIVIDGGPGVGRVTRLGLNQDIGQAAINTVPREMIYKEVMAVCEESEYTGGLSIIISIPQGEELARKTFNPRLGIKGGLSILGTTGIVEPMSETALIDTIRTEMSSLVAEGAKYLIAAPGNYGEAFVDSHLTLTENKTVKCSNFIGETIDMAFEFKLKGLLLVGHIGKLVKLGGGIMNTHSKWADGRMEILCSCGLLAGGDSVLLRKILNCITTDEALELFQEAGLLEAVMQVLMEKIDYHIGHRAYEGLTIGALVFSNKYGILGETKKVPFLINQLIGGECEV
ncbi:cobalt-precorrin-5B (C(1))-methyltransferase CbiD [Anaerocolumna sp. MB42-C2]|uniref:cobalt-precorrin-5B (C(1))-methyltransferase CbiD n=1 Tax=Anaerocolumna sp. MB42-C2 TaxID=3070997 RepID=UPI0027E20CA2|nr:cobalt-precorrin-5B (C(1))-methyltransferase CbiD [Anaerocolumna sp. MB42-C2]WMJ89535.1 cobalt-precorrin-5B (C(1))-methyltransferase CbiD [Anaerocolumna sp. MB42-C2]